MRDNARKMRVMVMDALGRMKSMEDELHRFPAGDAAGNTLSITMIMLVCFVRSLSIFQLRFQGRYDVAAPNCRVSELSMCDACALVQWVSDLVRSRKVWAATVCQVSSA